MKQELDDIMITNAVDKQKQEQLRAPTTIYHLQKNLLQMRALYGSQKEVQLARVPETESLTDMIKARKFSESYSKLQESTKLKKELQYTETIHPVREPKEYRPREGYRFLEQEGKVIVGLQKKLDENMDYI
jgi:hypothetical protein